MTPVPEYAHRLVAALLCWLALVVWGSAIVNFYPALTDAATQGYRAIASALAAPAMVWAFWVNTPRTALVIGAALVLCGSLLLVIQP